MKNDHCKETASASQQMRDVNSKEIFKNPTLCAQFLRDNMNIPMLKQVQPEDIEDVTERYQAYFGVEFETDTVKKIYLKSAKGERHSLPLFMISLIEHKSRVDYDITMQLLRYMVCIWHEYAKDMEHKKEGISKRKDFRYPPVLPIVYYEGSARWTAARRLRERICHGDDFASFVPDFHYEIVQIHEYSNQELLDRGDEMSLLMLLNKLQRADDFQAFSQSPPEKLEGILQNTPPDLIRLIQNVMYSLMMKINIPIAEANEYIKAIGGNQMGYLFENMEKIDIQAERRKTAEARKEREEAQEQARLAREEATMLQEQVAVMQEQLAEAQEQVAAAQERAAVTQEQAVAVQEQAVAAKREAEYKTYITTCQDFNCTREETIKQFILKYLSAFGNSSEEAETIARNKVDHYWGMEL